MMTKPVDMIRVDHPLPVEDFYFNYFTARKPVIIRTRFLAELGWRTHLWSNEYLNFKAGTHTVLVQKRQNNQIFLPENSGYYPVLFRDFLANVMANPVGDDTTYLNLQNLGNNQVLEPPALQLIGDFSIPVYFKDLMLRCINVWMGNSRTTITTPLHHDFNDNLYVVVEGRKHFTLFPPDQASNLYTRGQLLEVGANGIITYADITNMPHVSLLDIANPDRVRFPRYREAESQRLDFDLEKNEMLFLPAGWFHQVSSVDRHIALSFFAETPPAEKLQWMRDTLANRRIS